MTSRQRVAFFLVLAFVLVGCNRAGPQLAPSIPRVDGEIKTQYVMRYVDVVKGTGELAAAQHCFYVHYTGWLADGTKFDSSRDTTDAGQPRTPLDFRQGARQVIPGWDAGFEGMRVGGKRRLFIPYQVAYGENGRAPRIPPKAMLVFDIELLDVKPAPPPQQGIPLAQQRCRPWAERNGSAGSQH